ncbi:MAG: hypothetical protein GOV15_02860, partial [Candidatus Diapherotrites archaeon]|nr:hypothetical protein [Candidatus Diapherotrites archaeon]
MRESFDFVPRLMLARELSFGKGEVIMLDHHMTMVPVTTFVALIKQFNNNGEIGRALYEAGRRVEGVDFANRVKKKHGLHPSKFIALMFDVLNSSGLGIFHQPVVEWDEKRAVVKLESSKTALLYNGKAGV